jgi:hypothetical protein
VRRYFTTSPVVHCPDVTLYGDCPAGSSWGSRSIPISKTATCRVKMPEEMKTRLRKFLLRQLRDER